MRLLPQLTAKRHLVPSDSLLVPLLLAADPENSSTVLVSEQDNLELLVAAEELRLAAIDSTDRILRLLASVLLVGLVADRIVAVVRIAAAADALLTASNVFVPDSTVIESAEDNLESGNVHLVVELPETSLPLEGVSAIDSDVSAAAPSDLAVVVPAEQVDNS